ncbi:MAG: hypothetical protein H6708_33635 [Kofleriaceae bacterium]|nr:hypothetical protein [Myxococcales bacterium]MCB9565355.1 hypothetical protein [Kofleriaceae bacterium]
MLETTRRSMSVHAAALSIHDLDQASARLRAQTPWQRHGQSAVTLIKEPDLRVVLLELRAGARVVEHHTAARVTIHLLRGRVRMHVGDRTLPLVAGQLVMLAADVAHDVGADDDSTVLVTLAWSPAARAGAGATGAGS